LPICPHGVKTPSADAVATLDRSLTEAGLTVTPALAGCAWDDVISVAVTNGHAPDAEAPAEEPEVAVELDEAVELDGTQEQEVPRSEEAAQAVEDVEQLEVEAMDEAAALATNGQVEESELDEIEEES